MQEEWRQIPGAKGYEASSLGRIKSPRCILKTTPLNSGYLGVKIAARGTTAHAAVALAFIGPPPTARHTVNHKNGIKTDNRPENLEWLTQAENNRHAINVLGRQNGRPAKPKPQDTRQSFTLPLRALGWRDVRIEPRLGYIAWRCVDSETGEVISCKALGELLRWIAAQVPRQLGARNFM